MIKRHVRSDNWTEVVFADTREEAAEKALLRNTWGPPRNLPDFTVTVEDEQGSAQCRVTTTTMGAEWLLTAVSLSDG